jgi:hypothetical protein
MNDPQPQPTRGGAFAKVYRDLSTSGLLSELSGSQVKVLLVLALEAHVLGDARHPGGERHFRRLHELGVVLAADRGRLFCCLDRDTIAQRTGLARQTVTRATNALAERRLLEKRRVRNRKGRHDYCVYFVRSSSCLAKFDAGPPSAPSQGSEVTHGATGGQKPTVVHDPHVKKSTSSHRRRSDLPELTADAESGEAEAKSSGAETQGDGGCATASREAMASPQAPDAGAPSPAPVAGPRPPPTGDALQAAMRPVYQALQQAGWPVTGSLRRALRAKAVRVDGAAREQGASGPVWVADAMLVALGRKGGPPISASSPAPADEALLAYADGVLNNWMRDGRSRTAATHLHQGAARSPPVSRQGAPPEPPLHRHEGGVGHLLHREPKSEEEILWEQVLADLQLSMTKVSFDRWLRPTRLRALDRGVEGTALLVVEVDTPYAVEWLENRQKRAIQRAVEGRLRQGAEIRFQARETAGPE